jgi:hypothetical protein
MIANRKDLGRLCALVGKGSGRQDNLTDKNSDICPGCGRKLIFWACEAVCHYCGLKFTCDE